MSVWMKPIQTKILPFYNMHFEEFFFSERNTYNVYSTKKTQIGTEQNLRIDSIRSDPTRIEFVVFNVCLTCSFTTFMHLLNSSFIYIKTNSRIIHKWWWWWLVTCLDWDWTRTRDGVAVKCNMYLNLPYHNAIDFKNNKLKPDAKSFLRNYKLQSYWNWGSDNHHFWYMVNKSSPCLSSLF